MQNISSYMTKIANDGHGKNNDHNADRMCKKYYY